VTSQSEKKFFSESKSWLFFLVAGGGFKPFSMLQTIYPNWFPLNRPRVV